MSKITDILWSIEDDYRPNESDVVDERIAKAEKALVDYFIEQIIGENDDKLEKSWTISTDGIVENDEATTNFIKKIRNQLRDELRAKLGKSHD